MRHIVLSCIILLATMNGFSQSVTNPNYGLKTPKTLEIVRVDFGEDATVVWLTLTSDINNAFFCIDRETYLRKPDGSRLKMTGLKGLPNCPSTYRFKKPGEKVAFSITFPATGVLPWFSVVEQCAGGCMAVYGIVTDANLNSDLTKAYALADRGDNAVAYRLFEDIITRTDTLNLGIEGAVYTNLIILDRKAGRLETARSWYDRMMTSDTPDLAKYIDNLRLQGVSY